MDWSDLGKTISGFAPVLGGLIGGPGGAMVGKLIASEFGGDAEDPKQLAQLVKADPQAAIKLRELELNNKTEIQKLIVQSESNRLASETSRIESINSTMRTEAVSGDAWQRRWRPFWGYISGTAFFIQILAIIYIMIVQPAAAAAIIASIASLQVFWSVPLAVLGISAYQRGKEKRTALGENVQPLLKMFNK